MSVEDKAEEAVTPNGVGAQLRAAREKLGLSAEDVAKETRISQRHIENIDDGNFEALHGRAYAIGFAKTYAKVVGLDQGDVAALVRAEMGDDYASSHDPRNNFEPGDPTRAPGRTLVWFSIFAVILLLAGLFFAARALFAPAASLPSLISQQEEELAAEQAAAAAAASAQAEEEAITGGEVVFTAEGTAWVRFSDAQGRILMEAEMAEGDSYTIPADAEGPTVITGRPDLLAITIGGTSVPKLSEDTVTVVDVPVSATELLARDQMPVEPAGEAIASE